MRKESIIKILEKVEEATAIIAGIGMYFNIYAFVVIMPSNWNLYKKVLLGDLIWLILMVIWSYTYYSPEMDYYKKECRENQLII